MDRWWVLLWRYDAGELWRRRRLTRKRPAVELKSE